MQMDSSLRLFNPVQPIMKRSAITCHMNMIMQVRAHSLDDQGNQCMKPLFFLFGKCMKPLLSHTHMDVMFFGHNIWMDVQVDHQAAAAEGIW